MVYQDPFPEGRALVGTLGKMTLVGYILHDTSKGPEHLGSVASKDSVSKLCMGPHPLKV